MGMLMVSYLIKKLSLIKDIEKVYEKNNRK